MPVIHRRFPPNTETRDDDMGTGSFAASPGAFRDFMSRYPTGVAIVTSIDVDGGPCGMTCTSLASVCLTPPTLLVCLRSDSATFAGVRATGAFAINVLHARARDAAQLFSSGRPDRFRAVNWRRSPGGMPRLLDGVVAAADCAVVLCREVATHTVVLGEVRDLAIGGGDPLLYCMRRYHTDAIDHRAGEPGTVAGT